MFNEDDFTGENTQDLHDLIERQRERLDCFAEILLELGFDPADLLLAV